MANGGPGLSGHGRARLYGWLAGWVGLVVLAVIAAAVWVPGLVFACVVVGVFGLGVVFELARRTLSVDDQAEANVLAARALGLYFLWLALIAVPAFAYSGISLLSEVDDRAIRVAGLALVAVVLVLALLVLHDDRFRGYAARRSWVASLWVYAGTVATSASALFAGVTWELYRADVVELTPAPSNAASLVEFYLYYLADAMPGNVTETLRWEQPFDYTQTGVGVLVLVFTVAVAAPVLGFVVDQWRRRKAKRAEPGADRGPWWALLRR